MTRRGILIEIEAAQCAVCRIMFKLEGGFRYYANLVNPRPNLKVGSPVDLNLEFYCSSNCEDFANETRARIRVPLLD